MRTMGQKRCFWTPGMGVFEMDNANGAPNTHMSVHHGPEKLFLDRVGVFAIDNIKKCFGFRAGAPNTHTYAHQGPEKVFLDT